MIINLMGVSGSGKTTVGERLADRLGWKYYDGDDYHPRANIEKMSGGQPLNDEDRAAWLAALRDLIERLDAQGENAVIGSSALKRTYRDRLRGDSPGSVQFVYLKGSYDLLKERMEDRSGHFFDADLLASQFRALEEPKSDEQDVITVSVDQTPGAIVDEIVERLGLSQQ